MLTVVVTVFTFAVTTNNTNNDNRKQRELTEKANQAEQSLVAQGQITDRYSAAVDQLGNAQLDVRLGGVYALERIMRDSRSDQPTIVEVLFAFVRDRAPLHCPTGDESRDHPENDVQAALTVLGRRDPKRDQNKVKPDLNRTCLIGADLTGANLDHVNLTSTDLTCAHLPGVHLEQANMTLTQLGDAVLPDAKLNHATMTDTVLNDADLGHADLTGATLRRVDLTRAKVTAQQLATASVKATKPRTTPRRDEPCPK